MCKSRAEFQNPAFWILIGQLFWIRLIFMHRYDEWNLLWSWFIWYRMQNTKLPFYLNFNSWFVIVYLCKILHGVVALTAKEIATLEIASVFKNIQSRATQTDTFIDKHNWQHYAKIPYTILHTSAKIAWASLAHNRVLTFVKSSLNFTTLSKLFILLHIKTYTLYR